MATADQRRTRIGSPSTSTASTLAKIGAVKPSAVASASGIRDSAVNEVIMAMIARPARNRCRPMRCVRSAPTP
jgi:hypothetical protein